VPMVGVAYPRLDLRATNSKIERTRSRERPLAKSRKGYRVVSLGCDGVQRFEVRNGAYGIREETRDSSPGQEARLGALVIASARLEVADGRSVLSFIGEDSR
jgi:hypothetical protein